MRKAFPNQRQLDCRSVLDVELNFECRDEIIPILRGLQHLYSQSELRDQILQAVADDVNGSSRDDCGREGMDYWQILVLASVRLGCNLDYDKLQDLAEQHRNLRHIMGLGDWNDRTAFSWRRIRDNVCLVSLETLDHISLLIIQEGHRLAPQAAERVRADSFVVGTNIHYPSESTLIRDGIRKLLELAVPQAEVLGLAGWRQHEHLWKKIKQISRNIERIAARKGANSQERLKTAYRELLQRSGQIVERVRELIDVMTIRLSLTDSLVLSQLQTFLQRTEQVRGTARRRVLLGESVPNNEKLFSLFEPHTQLYRRGKAGEPNQFGRLVLVFEDGLGFVTQHHVLPRDAQDGDVVVEQSRIVQTRHKGRIKRASFDRGFHSPENQEQLAKLFDCVCLPKPGKHQSAEQEQQATETFLAARQNHPGVESAIGALQSGNGLESCRDCTEVGFERYVALGVLGRNLYVLGKLLIAREFPKSEAAKSCRNHAA